MCLNMTYYPLVINMCGKKEILFNYFVRVNDRDTFNDMVDISKQCQFARIGESKYHSLNLLFKKEQFKEFVKMISIPCGKCAECLKNQSREWAYRIYLESLRFPNRCWFISFTYDDEHLPKNMMLEKDAISKLNKKLKVYLSRNNLDSSFRFYGVGEYGSKFARPHYHVIYFGLDIPDLKYVGKTKDGYLLYGSDFLEKIWSNGFVHITDLGIGAACYVARYCDKKKRLTKEEKLSLIDKGIVPEFSVMSRRPGIGSYYFDKICDDFNNGIYTHFVNGNSYSIPIAWRKRIKNECDSDLVFIYENFADINANAKINQLLNISDVCSLDSYLDSLDVIKTKRSL